MRRQLCPDAVPTVDSVQNFCMQGDLSNRDRRMVCTNYKHIFNTIFSYVGKQKTSAKMYKMSLVIFNRHCVKCLALKAIPILSLKILKRRRPNKLLMCPTWQKVLVLNIQAMQDKMKVHVVNVTLLQAELSNYRKKSVG